MAARTILYARVSTSEQNVNLQRTHAEAAGYKLDEIVVDEGVSGVSTKLKEREGGKRLFDLLRGGDTLVVRWVDRLGRNYDDVCAALREFMQRKIVVRTIINGMTFDGSTTDPMQQAVRDALIGFMAAMAQAQAEATKEAQKTGIAHAKDESGSYLGRKPTYSKEQIELALSMRGEGKTVSGIAKSLSLTRQTVYRILDDPAEAMRIVAQWRPKTKSKSLATAFAHSA
jgi:putative DNA-invertase from lambdoid prophage Rac